MITASNSLKIKINDQAINNFTWLEALLVITDLFAMLLLKSVADLSSVAYYEITDTVNEHWYIIFSLSYEVVLF